MGLCFYCESNESDDNVYLSFDNEGTIRRPICFACKANKEYRKELK